MPKFTLDDDDGYLEVTLKAGGGAATSRLDMYRAYNAYNALHDQYHDAVDLADAWVAWLTSQGLPPMSHGAAFKLIAAVQEQVADLKKTPDSTTSPPADSSASTAAPSAPPTSDCPAPARS